MAYYAGLVSVIQILDEIINRDQYEEFHFDKNQIASVHDKFCHLQALLDDYWPKDREAADFLESRIRDAAKQAEDIIETQIHTSKVEALVLLELLKKMKKEVKSVMEELQFQLFEEIRHHHGRDPRTTLTKIASLYEKFKLLQQELLDKDQSADFLETRIRDAACRTLDIIKTCISNQRHEGGMVYLCIFGKEYVDFEKVKKEVDSILEALSIKMENLTTHEQLIIIKSQLRSDDFECVATVDFVPLVHLLGEITHHVHLYPHCHLDKAQIICLHQKFLCLHGLLNIQQDLVEESIGFREILIKDVKIQAHDIIETHISNQICVPHWLEEIIDISACQNTKPPQELEKVKEEIDSIMEEMRRIKIEGLRTYDSANIPGPSTQAQGDGTSTVGFDEQLTTHAPSIDPSSAGTPKVQALGSKSTVVGCDEHLRTIKEQLCGQSLRREVISIVGMGGIGKTTLARSIFDDKLVEDRFDCRVLVIISQDYHPQNIFQAIVSSLEIEVEEEALGDRIYKHLKGRRYLIIMDDVWDLKVWDDIKRVLPDDHNGSRIMITTRQSDVASYASTSAFINHIPLLNEHQSWNLFCEKMSCPPELEDIGRLISKNCRGLPLAIVVVAGLLSNPNTTPYDWKEIAKGISSTAAKTDDHFSKILSLSYNHLPHHLKPCFLYLGGFPRDYEIRISKLMKLWVAEGFLKPLESKCLEEAAEKYFEELVNRNLVLITKWGYSGKFKYCIIHDLLRELCSERARYEKFHFIYKNEERLHEEAIRNAPRLCVHKLSSFSKFEVVKNVFNDVRSIRIFNSTGDHRIPNASRLLRVLDSPYIIFELFPNEPNQFFRLLHLRFLTLNFRMGIPGSISKLENLQTLYFPSKNYDTLLLLEIWKMPHLRHVMIERVELPPLPDCHERIIDGVPLLGALQTLYTVVNFTFTRNTVEIIFPNLKKLKLCLKNSFYDHRKNPWVKPGLHNLIHLRQLEKLEIRFGYHIEENFAFPLSLKELSLEGWALTWKYIRAMSLLPNLQLLKLKFESFSEFSDDQWEQGHFPKLKFLIMESLDLWLGEDMSFPCLERLILIRCRSGEIPCAIGDIQTLELIELNYCSSALESSALAIQEEQRDLGNDILQVRIRNRYR